MKNAAELLDRLTGYLNSDPQNLKLLLDCLAAARAAKDMRASEFLARALQIDPHNAKALFAAGEMAMDERNHDAAIGYFGQLLQDPAAANASRYNLAMAQLLLGQYEEAESALLPLTTLAQIWPETWGLLGRILFFRKRIEEAKVALERCVVEDPRNGDALGLLALLSVDIGDKAASAYAERALSVNAANYEALLALASVALLEDRLPEARRRFTLLLEQFPVTGRALLGLGLLDMREGRYPEAETTLQQCVALMPANADVQNGLGWTLLANAKTQQAVDAFRAALALAENNAEFRSALACALVFAGHLEEARAQLALAKQGGISANWTEWLLDLHGKATPEGPLDVRKITAEALGPQGTSLQSLMHKLVKAGKLPPRVLH